MGPGGQSPLFSRCCSWASSGPLPVEAPGAGFPAWRPLLPGPGPPSICSPAAPASAPRPAPLASVFHVKVPVMRLPAPAPSQLIHSLTLLTVYLDTSSGSGPGTRTSWEPVILLTTAGKLYGHLNTDKR